MATIVVRKKGSKWEKCSQIDFSDEAQLQTLLYESPELIPAHDEKQRSAEGSLRCLPNDDRRPKRFNKEDVLSKAQPTTKFSSLSEETIRGFRDSERRVGKGLA